MSDRYCGLTIILDKDYRDDDSEIIINAIKMIKGVQSVEPIILKGADILNSRAKFEIKQKLYDFIDKI